MRTELDASTSTVMDAGEARWRAGANRQAQPDAASHQQAASRAAAAKRKATAMSGEEKYDISATMVTFELAHECFDDLHDGKAVLLAESDEPLFHEAGVWMPSTQEWLITSNRLLQGSEDTHVKISAISLSGKVRPLPHLSKQVLMANGGTTDFAGGAYLCSQGLGHQSGSLWHIDKEMQVATRIGPPTALTLNSLNDCVVHTKSHEIIFTDPAYGLEAQGFRSSYNETKAVWSVHPDHASEASDWVPVAQCASQPNGVLLSPDEHTAYVTDVWAAEWHRGTVKLKKPFRCEKMGGEAEVACILAYDVSLNAGGRVVLSGGRKFVDLRTEGASGYPDGIKCDEQGNVYAGCGGGVRVYSPAGTFLGQISIDGGVSNLCFGGADGKALLMLNETRAFIATMKCRGALHEADLLT